MELILKKSGIKNGIFYDKMTKSKLYKPNLYSYLLSSFLGLLLIVGFGVLNIANGYRNDFYLDGVRHIAEIPSIYTFTYFVGTILFVVLNYSITMSHTKWLDKKDIQSILMVLTNFFLAFYNIVLFFTPRPYFLKNYEYRGNGYLMMSDVFGATFLQITFFIGFIILVTISTLTIYSKIVNKTKDKEMLKNWDLHVYCLYLNTLAFSVLLLDMYNISQL